MFYIGAAIYVVGWIVYVILADTNEQPWARPTEEGGTETKTTFQKNGGYVWNSEIEIIGKTDTDLGENNGGLDHAYENNHIQTKL